MLYTKFKTHLSEKHSSRGANLRRRFSWNQDTSGKHNFRKGFQPLSRSWLLADGLWITITFLIKHNLLVEHNGIYYQACNADKFNEAETQNIFAD